MNDIKLYQAVAELIQYQKQWNKLCGGYFGSTKEALNMWEKYLTHIKQKIVDLEYDDTHNETKSP